MLLVTALCLFLFAGFGCSQNPSENYPHQAVLDAGGKFKLYWKFNQTFITFEMIGQTTGWVGVGISPNGGMIKADIYVGWVKNGTAYVTDRHGVDSNTFPPKDPEQNVELLGGSECNGWTMIKFQRQIVACENSYDITITTDTTKMIWALGAQDPSGDDITSSNYHGNGAENRGVKSLLLLESTGASPPPANETTMSFNLLNNGTTIPAKDTYYNCRLLKLPAFSSKKHAVKIEPIIEAAYMANVHHIVLYLCDFQTPMQPNSVGQNHECSTPNMPPDFESCQITMHAWAIGGGAFYYPNHVGFPIGEVNGSKYVVLETHYDNPQLKSDIRDSSGLKITYTSQLRQYDAGVMEVGHLVSPYQHLIPPNVDNYLSYGECPEDCLSAGMMYKNRTNIKLFGALLHTHLLGQALTLKHIRNGTELPPIATDNAYDFNYQEVKRFTKEVMFSKGESMQLVCNYKSKGARTNFTVGGLGTKEEMCLAFVYYYPRIPIIRCETAPVQNFLYEYFGIKNYTYTAPVSIYGTLRDILVTDPPMYANKTVWTVLHNMTWDQTSGINMSDTVKTLVRQHLCQASVSLTNVSYWGFPPEIKEPYVAAVANCTPPTTGMPTNGSVDMCMTTVAPTTTGAMTTTPVRATMPITTTSSAAPLGGIHVLYAIVTAISVALLSVKW